MSLVKNTNKKTGVTYVYESESYWDKEKKQPRNKRKLIGRIDEETGEIVPTGGHGRRRKEPPGSAARKDMQDMEKRLLEKEQEIQRLLLEKQQIEKDFAILQDGLQNLLEKSRCQQR